MSEIRRSQPAFNIPTVVVVLIGLCIGIFLLQDQLGGRFNLDLIRLFGFIPARMTGWFDPNALASLMQDLSSAQNGRDAAMAQFFIGDGAPYPWMLLSYAFLHGSWAHVLLNSLWLMSFGAAVARRFGTVPFLIFFAVTAIAGAGAHFMVHPLSPEPVIGASAAVSGCMGAALRFAFAPGAPLGGASGVYFLTRNAPYRLPAPPLRAVLSDSRAMTFLLVWFGVNLVFGVGSTSFGLSDAPIAWEAHIGGFLAGFVLFPLFDRFRT